MINEVVDINKSESRVNEISSSLSAITQKVLFASKKAFGLNLEENVQNAINTERELLKIIK